MKCLAVVLSALSLSGCESGITKPEPQPTHTSIPAGPRIAHDDPEQVQDIPAPLPPVAKLLDHSDPLLGDVTGDGTVDAADALALFGHLLNPSDSGLTHAFLGDIDQNGEIEFADVGLITAYVMEGTNNHGIGELVEITLSAWLVPDPASVDFEPNGEWNTFRVETTADSLLVRVNGDGTDVILEIAGGSRPPSRNFCGAEANDSPRRARRNGWNLHLAGCADGSTEVLLMDWETREVLKVYSIAISPENAEEVEDYDGEGQSVSGKVVYWEFGSFFQADLDGSNLAEMFSLAGASPNRLWADESSRTLYFTDCHNRGLVRVDWDGSDPEVNSKVHCHSTVHIPSGKAYWITDSRSRTGVDTLIQINLDGTDRRQLRVMSRLWHEKYPDRSDVILWIAGVLDEQILVGQADIVGGSGDRRWEYLDHRIDPITGDLLVEDETWDARYFHFIEHRGVIYWVNKNDDRNNVIMRADLDGSNHQSVYETGSSVDALQAAGNRLYWTFYEDEKLDRAGKTGVRRAFLDGSSVQEIIVRSHISQIHALAVVEE